MNAGFRYLEVKCAGCNTHSAVDLTALRRGMQGTIVAISPDSPADRLDRARLRLQSGDSTGAKQDFKWLLDNESPGIDLERITEIYRAL